MAHTGFYVKDAEKATIVKLRLNGVSISQIAKRELVSESTVKRILKNNLDNKPKVAVN